MEQDLALHPDHPWLEQERELLRKLSEGVPAPRVLEDLCTRMAHLMNNGERCAIHLLDTDGLRIVQVIAPGLEEFFRWRGPIWVGPAEGTSSAAACLRREITTDHLDEYLSVVDPDLNAAIRKWNIGSMRARPVMSASGTVLAVLSIYYRQPLAQEQQHAWLIDWAAQLVRTVLQQEHRTLTVKPSAMNFDALVNHMHDGLFIVQQGIIVFVNPSMTAITGRPERALLDNGFDALLDPQDAVKFRDLKARRDRGERVPHECKLHLALPNGEVRVMRYVESAITWNNAPATLATLADISEHEKSEGELKRHNAELEKHLIERTRELAAAHRELERIRYTVSHDLRAPVRTINGFCSVLAEDHGSHMDAETLNCLDHIHGAARRMNDMIQGLLTLTHAARKVPRFSQVDLSAMSNEGRTH